MAIQIGTLRTWTQKDGTESKPFFKAVKGFYYNTLKELFDTIEHDLDNHLGKNEQFNLFYTVGHHLEGQRTKTSWQCQEIVPFDLDGIDLDQIDLYPPLVAEACGFDLDKCSIVYSGNGIHILVQVPTFGKDDKEYIKEKRLGYKQAYDRIMKACKEAGLPIEKDTTAWDYARILRCPFTVNKKLKKQEDGSIKEVVKECRIIQNNLQTQDWEIPQVKKVKESLSLKVGTFPRPDTNEVSTSCEFFKWLKDKPDEVHEPHAYAMLSIAGHFSDEHETAKKLYSNFSSPSISAKPFDEFIEQALSTSGPRTCKGIDDVWGKCNTCPHFNKVTSPILLKGPDHIGTEFLGFTTLVHKGNSISTKRHYEDLRKWYKREKNYIHIPNRRSTLMEFNGKYFEEISESHIKAVAQKNFAPLVEDDKIRTQFLNQVKAAPDTLKSDSFLHGHKENLINLNNGILDLEKGALLPHSIEYGFTAVIDYDYDEAAECPNWDNFIKAAMRGNQKLVDLIEELLAFTLSGMPYDKFQFYFLLIGKGFNGKSTFITLLQRMLGTGNYTAHPLEDLIDKQDARAELSTSLANLVADSSATALKGKDLTRLKSWTGNDAVTGRALYKDSISFINKSKFIFGFNDYPEIKTTSIGDNRRIKAIPFDADFKGVDKGFFIKDLEKRLVEERSGILNRVVTAYDRLLKNGFSHCDTLDNMKTDIRKNADSVYDFLTDFVEYKEGGKVFAEDIYNAYTQNNDYSAANYAKQPRTFNKELRNIIETNDAMSTMEFKQIRLGSKSGKGLFNAVLKINNTVSNRF